MQYVSATDAKQAFAATIDMAQRSPVVIKRQNREIAVIISPKDYERLTRLNIEEFQSFRNEVASKAKNQGLTQKKLDALLNDKI
ncbi:MAG: type II toxin-antitoxin system Phd/YefM family antitoxin [Pseudomonadota bacterium]